ncbi:kinase-like domain-containing protein [Mycena vulgaris]|nr:kinase-like domain-containing protein [Mycena vulgaris]
MLGTRIGFQPTSSRATTSTSHLHFPIKGPSGGSVVSPTITHTESNNAANSRRVYTDYNSDNAPKPERIDAASYISRLLDRTASCLRCISRNLKCDGNKPMCGSCHAQEQQAWRFSFLSKCEYPKIPADGPSQGALDPTAPASPTPENHRVRHQTISDPEYPKQFRSRGTPSIYSTSSRKSAFSLVESDDSLAYSLFHSTHSLQSQNTPNYDVLSHRRSLQDLDLTGIVVKLDLYPFDSGGAADIYRGTLKSSKLLVAIKMFRRMHSEPEALEAKSRSLYEEARIWKQLEHPNILPFLGITLDLGPSPAIVSPLCVSGPIMKYLKQASTDTKGRLQMAIGVADGLAYLHSERVLHGNLCTKRILVADGGCPVICGYGIAKALHQPPNTAFLFSSPIRFSPPEYFSVEDDTSSVRTESADIYAFSMVALEILSGLEPYHHLPTEHAVLKHIIRGEPPIRTHLDGQAISNRMWRLLSSVWIKDPALRPRMVDVIASLIQIRDDTTDDGDFEYVESSQPGSPVAQHGNDERMSSGEEASFGDEALPDIQSRDLNGRVTQDDQYPFAGGGNSNIYRGKLRRSDGRKIRVAIKMIRLSNDGSGQQEEVLRRLKREVDVWSRLKHTNVLPLIGVCDDIAPFPVLISPFYKFGHVGTYLRKYPATDREYLVHGVASGLQFLHDNDIIHGDLKVQNILVDKRGTPCICDFGISKIINRRGFTTSSTGTAPYMAPELFFVVDGSTPSETCPKTTKSSDMYSFALLVLEILTSEPPKGRPTRPILTIKVFADLRPKRRDYGENEVPNATWLLLDRCWNFEPQLRPAISEVLHELSI